MDFLELWLLMEQIVEPAVKWISQHRCDISVAVQLKQVGSYNVLQKWLHTCIPPLFCSSVSSVENNQHRCWLVRLLISLLPYTRPFQWVVTRAWCSARWPWESEGTGLSSRCSSSSLQRRLVREWIKAADGSLFPHLPSFLTRMVFEDVWACVWGGSMFLFHWGFHRGRLVGLWVPPAHELIAGKSISRSTHRANWVPVFVWDDEEGVPPYQPWPVPDTLWLTEHVVSDFVMSSCPSCPSTVKIWDKTEQRP